jgi:hypothetical protein
VQARAFLVIVARRYDVDASRPVVPQIVAAPRSTFEIGPDGRPYVLTSESIHEAVGWPRLRIRGRRHRAPATLNRTLYRSMRSPPALRFTEKS